MKLEKGRSYIADILEDLAGDIITLTGCTNTWGEIELPECLKDQEEE
ncbi:MAG: hypothetical protein PUG00_10865 [Clostridiales bacterium]|nr:hypothetical protein [Clostridiales bacterium]